MLKIGTTLGLVMAQVLALDIRDILEHTIQSRIESKAPKRSLCLDKEWLNMDERLKEFEILSRHGELGQERWESLNREKVQKAGFFPNGYTYALSKVDLFGMFRVWDRAHNEVMAMGAADFYERFPMYKSSQFLSLHEGIWPLEYPFLAFTFRLDEDYLDDDDRPIVHVLNVETLESELVIRGNRSRSHFSCTIVAVSRDAKFFADSCDGRIRFYASHDPQRVLVDLPNGSNHHLARNPSVIFVEDTHVALVQRGIVNEPQELAEDFFTRVDLGSERAQSQTISISYSISDAAGLYVISDRYKVASSLAGDTQTLAVVADAHLWVFSFIHNQEIMKVPLEMISTVENMGFCDQSSQFFVQSRSGEVRWMNINKALPAILAYHDMPLHLAQLEHVIERTTLAFEDSKKQSLSEWQSLFQQHALTPSQGLDHALFQERHKSKKILSQSVQKVIATKNPMIISGLADDLNFHGTRDHKSELSSQVRWELEAFYQDVQYHLENRPVHKEYERWLVMKDLRSRLYGMP